MNSPNLENKISPKLLAKALTIFGFLALALLAAFFSLRTSSQTLPDCSSITGTAQPGLNCLFFGMPLCKEVPNAGYTISSSYVLPTGTTPQHRVNCADLSDLPLCNQMDVNTALPGKNCVKECLDNSFPNQTTGTRGQDYAVHNRDCIRFQDEVATENTTYGSDISSTDNYYFTGRNCHHWGANDTPDSTSTNPNCNLLPCNLLTPDELNDVKFDDANKRYCDGDYDWSGATLKCYKFTQSQLPYVKLRATNTMCKIHDCKPSSSNCSADDTLNISNQGTAYTNTYITYINAGYSLDSTALCTPVICKPTVTRQYRCLPIDDSNPTTPSSLCDTSGDGSTCTDGYCYKTIDCNLAANASEPECGSSIPSDEDSSIGSTEDIMDSWFYRPKPMNKALSGGVLREGIGGDLCYSKGDLKDNGWGNNTIFGYFHDYAGMDSRSPGICGVKYNSGGRGTGYIYLCGPNGKLYANVKDYTAFHKGYVETTFSDTDATHKLVVCLRFNNTLAPTKTCGSRECGITCAFDICKAKACGFDVCRELTVKDSNMDECMMDDDLFNSARSSKKCLSIIDDYLRIRAVKYGNRICTFLDVKGQLAYPSAAVSFFSGSEKLSDGTCVSGKTNSSGHCSNGKNTRDTPGSAQQWRTVLQIPYIQNNRQDPPYGYLDSHGKLFHEQECIQAALRVSPPRIYNLGNIDNSLKLFIPPVYVLNVRTTKGGSISIPNNTTDTFGSTDFNTPELEVKFGTTTQKLSLSADKTGYESTAAQDQNSMATLTTTISGSTYSVDVFVRKEYSSVEGRGKFCLYRKVRDANGAELAPSLVQCVDRSYAPSAKNNYFC